MKTTTLALALALALPGAALAQGRNAEFGRRDRNNDGLLTQAEYGGHPGNFAAFDRNGDGVLTYEEFIRRPTEYDRGPEVGDRDARDLDRGVARRGLAWRDVQFHEMDRNRDDAVERYEWAGTADHFALLDLDGDGRIEGREYSYPKRLESWFRSYDRNRDGVIDRREYRRGRGDFQHWDRNGDGRVERREVLL